MPQTPDPKTRRYVLNNVTETLERLSDQLTAAAEDNLTLLAMAEVLLSVRTVVRAQFEPVVVELEPPPRADPPFDASVYERPEHAPSCLCVDCNASRARTAELTGHFATERMVKAGGRR